MIYCEVLTWEVGEKLHGETQVITNDECQAPLDTQTDNKSMEREQARGEQTSDRLLMLFI